MSGMLAGFNAADFLSGVNKFEAMPTGWYFVTIEELKVHEEASVAPVGWKQNRNGTGYHLVLAYTVEGTHKNDAGRRKRTCGAASISASQISSRDSR